MTTRNVRYIIGIDEAGRGPLAGPVSVGVCIIAKPVYKKILKRFNQAKDSKQLSPKQREEIFQEMVLYQKSFPNNFGFEVGFSSAQIIDQKGIVFAINSAMKKALQKALQKIKKNQQKSSNQKNFSNQILLPEHCEILLDGSLHAPKEYIHQKTIIKGDQKEKIISLASIAAKVLRDKKMKEYAKKFPQYLFEIHKGYGTAKHYEAIKKQGLSDIHRKSFLKNYK